MDPSGEHHTNGCGGPSRSYCSYASAGAAARSGGISTIDSHAWSLRAGFDDERFLKSPGDGSYDLSIDRTIELSREQTPGLVECMARIEHLLIDEAQDVTGPRADLVIEMLKILPPICGVTSLADPAQAEVRVGVERPGTAKPVELGQILPY